MDGQAIHDLARQLVSDGYLDNEPDALIAAIEIMTAAEELASTASAQSAPRQLAEGPLLG